MFSAGGNGRAAVLQGTASPVGGREALPGAAPMGDRAGRTRAGIGGIGSPRNGLAAAPAIRHRQCGRRDR